MFRIALAATFAAVSTCAYGATLSVGPGKTYSTLAAASAKANAGDTVIVYPGVYTSGAYWYDNNLTIRTATGAAPGSVIVRGGSVGGKGLFVTKGSDITVSGIRFENARVADGNGAGIRAEGKNLTVINSQFYGNEMGILANSVTGSTLTVRGSSFDLTRSLQTGHIGHSIYANSIDKLVVENSKFTRNYVGHYIKSRAKSAVIDGNQIDDTNGTASYLIDLSEGGGAAISNNVLVKGANASNCCTAIAYGFVMNKGGSYVNPPGPVTVSGNVFTNYRASTVTFFANRSTPPNPATLSDNTMIGKAGTIKLSSGPVAANAIALDFAESSIFNTDLSPDFATMSGLGVSDFAADSPAEILASAQSINADVPIPEPGTIAILGVAGLALAAARRYRRR